MADPLYYSTRTQDRLGRGGSEVDGGWGVEPKESSISSEISSFEGKNFLNSGFIQYTGNSI